MEAALPIPNGSDPFAALQQRFAALDEVHNAEYSKAKAVIKSSKAAVSRIKRSAEAATNGDSKARLCIKEFTESDEQRCDDIEAAAETAIVQRHEPVTKVMNRTEVRARLEAAAQAATSDQDTIR